MYTMYENLACIIYDTRCIKNLSRRIKNIPKSLEITNTIKYLII